MSLSFVKVALSATLFFAAWANAEQHTIRMVNKCGTGTPTLILDGQIVSTGADYVGSGSVSGIAYLQTGDCGFNGENCCLLEMTLGNPTVPGGGSSTDISLIPPHAFNVQTSFAYFGGCDGQGADCSSGNCDTAFFNPNDNQVQVQCETDNVNLLIEFCGDATQTVNGGGASAPASSSVAVHTSTAAPPPTTHATSTVVHTTSHAPATSSPVIISTSAAPVNVGAPPSSSLAVSSSIVPPSVVPSSVASAPSASASVPNRKQCKSKQRRSAEAAVDTTPVDTDARPRALYDARRRHHARMMDDARRRSHL